MDYQVQLWIFPLFIVPRPHPWFFTRFSFTQTGLIDCILPNPCYISSTHPRCFASFCRSFTSPYFSAIAQTFLAPVLEIAIIYRLAFRILFFQEHTNCCYSILSSICFIFSFDYFFSSLGNRRNPFILYLFSSPLFPSTFS